MLRIIPLPARDGDAVMRVEGEIREAWVQVLEEECTRRIAGGSAQPVALDLQHVTYVDAAGRALLRGLTTMGIQLRNCPPLIAAQLEDTAP